MHDSFTDDELNAVRERAFTPELRSLVDDITRDKQSASADPQELLRRMHALFYRMLAHDNRPDCGAGFNPLEQGDETNELVLLDALQHALAMINISDFALLFYSVMEKAFVPHFNTFDDIHPNRFRLSLYENTYNMVFDNARGIVIDRERFQRHDFLRERLLETDFDGSNLYCVCLSSILPRAFRDSYSCLPTAPEPYFTDDYLPHSPRY
jgi:hypothetical protein